MQVIHRALLGSACALSLLSGCNFESTSAGLETARATDSAPSVMGTGSSAPPGIHPGSGAVAPADAVNATPSVSGTVSVMSGASQTLTVAFTSADGRPVSGFALSNTTLPPGWTGPAGFTCTATAAGSNCVLSLTYSPTKVETGTLSVSYVYVGDEIAPPGVVLSIPYAGTSTNNLIATAAPIGQINAVAGTGTQAVSVNFTTDDGNTATGLTVSSLASLPAGWSTTTPGFSCAVITTGSGCQLVLNYAPKVAGSGTLTLNYGYIDGAGMTRTAAINLPYSTTANGSVVATVSPAGQVNAVQPTGKQAVTVTFTTDDGKAAHDLMMLSPQSALPAGWTGPVAGFTCGSVGIGGGCQLSLNYSPTALTRGTVTLNYGYTSPAGGFTTGSVNIHYAATTNDNIVASAAPTGEIDAVVGQSSPAIAVSFTTDDARTATALQLTTDLAMLPAGWTSTDSMLSCAGVTGSATCLLPLSYGPTAADSGTLTLRYSYLNNAGQSKTGSLNVPYRAMTDDSVVGTAGPASPSVTAGASTPVTITFATDDGNAASTLAVTSSLDVLPAGWSAAGTPFACATVSSGTVCQLALTYAPPAADTGTLSIGFSYTNNAGIAKTGTVVIPYTAN